MKIHEYQARQLLEEAEVPVPSGRMCTTVDEVVAAEHPRRRRLHGRAAQVHAGAEARPVS